jgi:hypothetical protein
MHVNQQEESDGAQICNRRGGIVRRDGAARVCNADR